MKTLRLIPAAVAMALLAACNSVGIGISLPLPGGISIGVGGSIPLPPPRAPESSASTPSTPASAPVSK